MVESQPGESLGLVSNLEFFLLSQQASFSPDETGVELGLEPAVAAGCCCRQQLDGSIRIIGGVCDEARGPGSAGDPFWSLWPATLS